MTQPTAHRVRTIARPFLSLVLGILVGLTACSQSSKKDALPPDRADAGAGNKPWYAGTEQMQEQIASLVQQIPHTTGAGRLELGRRIVGHGEPAVPQLVDALRAPDAATRGTAAWLLGFVNDPRTIPPLVCATGDRESLVRYEAATTLVRLGDRRGLDLLIQGLDDTDPRIRQKCVDVLERQTGETFGYRADDTPADRCAATARWRAWAAATGGGCR